PAASGGSGNTATKAQAPATIRFMRRSGNPPSQEPTLFAEQIPLFQAKYPHIKIEDEQTAPGGEFYEKVTILAAGGTLGDVTWASVGGGGIYNLAAQKLLLALDPLVARDKLDLGQYYKGCVDGLKRDGKLFGLPFKAHPGVSILYYNQTEFERAGAGVPDKSWTLDKFLDAAKKVTKPGDVYGYNPATSQKSVLTFTRAFGGELLDPEGKKTLINSPQALAAITWMYEAFNKHNIAPQPKNVSAQMESIDKGFTTGKLLSGKWGTSFQNTAARDVKDSFKWFASLHPKGPGNVPGSDYEIDSMSITSTSKVPDQGFEWVKWLTNQESGIRLGEIGGTVGGRPDVYKSERLLKDPVRRVFLEAMETAQPGRPLYNTRMVEYEKEIEDGLRPVWNGEQAPSKGYMDELARKVQVILDRPLP
ncbi:MAG TPA: extracellular solute-binding protein, partial [Chloroflexota bacterium]|nr:extracellular solute-binding protein [Chloroflexota bacterium]